MFLFSIYCISYFQIHSSARVKPCKVTISMATTQLQYSYLHTRHLALFVVVTVVCLVFSNAHTAPPQSTDSHVTLKQWKIQLLFRPTHQAILEDELIIISHGALARTETFHCILYLDLSMAQCTGFSRDRPLSSPKHYS